MAKQRWLNTRLWSDSWFSDLDPVEKLLFIYLITNERTNIAGIYELPLKLMSTETGIEKEMVQKIIKRFEVDKKVKYYKNWIGVLNFTKYQDTDNQKIQLGIKRVLEETPKDVVDDMFKSGYLIDRVSIGYQYPSDNSNLNFNLTDIPPAAVGNSQIPKNEKDPRVKEIISFFFKEFSDRMNTPPIINGGSDGGMIQRTLRILTKEEIFELIEFFFSSKKSEEHPTISAALSAHTINLWKIKGHKKHWSEV